MLRDIKNEIREGKTLFQFGFLKALSLITPLVIAGFFSEDMFGTYTLAKLVVFFFVTMLVTAPQVPFVVYASRERAETGKVNKSFSIQSVFFVLGIIVFTVVTIIFNRSICSFAEITVRDLIYVSFGFLGIALSSFVCNLFLAMGERVKSSLAEFTYGTINLGLVIAICLAGRLNIRTVFGAYFISGTAVLIVFARAIDIRALLPFRFDLDRFRQMFNFTKWVFIGAMATYFIDWSDNIILKIFSVPIADIGQYGLAYSIFNGVVSLIYILNSYFLPFVSENIKDSDRIREYLFRKRPRILLFGIVLLAVAFVVCPLFFKVVYPDSYHESVLILRILLVGCVMVLYNTFYIPLLNSLELYRFSQATNVAHMIIKVALNVALIRLWGFYGAAVGTVVSYLLVTVVYECYYQFKMKRLMGISTQCRT
ncbi:MAG: polysaccharide biosynthesis C-terminal domain-containing protein [Planctomycetota bacterium]